MHILGLRVITSWFTSVKYLLPPLRCVASTFDSDLKNTTWSAENDRADWSRRSNGSSFDGVNINIINKSSLTINIRSLLMPMWLASKSFVSWIPISIFALSKSYLMISTLWLFIKVVVLKPVIVLLVFTYSFFKFSTANGVK